MNTVSIVIPTYNSLRWLPEAVDSALSQTYPNCEIIIVDDGSTDGSSDWLNSLTAENVHVFRKDNGGLASARNHGLQNATGTYIQFLDADDFISSDKIFMQVKFLDANPDHAAVYGESVCFYDGEPDRLHRWNIGDSPPSGDVAAAMLDEPFILTHAILTRREWIDRVGLFNESLSEVVDGEYWMRMALAGAQFAYLSGEPMATYRLRKDSQSANSLRQPRTMVQILRKIESEIATRQEKKRLRIRRAIGNWQTRYGFALMDAGNIMAGWREVAASLLKDQRNPMPRVARLILVPVFGWNKTQSILRRVRSIGQRPVHN